MQAGPRKSLSTRKAAALRSRNTQTTFKSAAFCKWSDKRRRRFCPCSQTQASRQAGRIAREAGARTVPHCRQEGEAQPRSCWDFSAYFANHLRQTRIQRAKSLSNKHKPPLLQEAPEQRLLLRLLEATRPSNFSLGTSQRSVFSFAQRQALWKDNRQRLLKVQRRKAGGRDHRNSRNGRGLGWLSAFSEEGLEQTLRLGLRAGGVLRAPRPRSREDPSVFLKPSVTNTTSAGTALPRTAPEEEAGAFPADQKGLQVCLREKATKGSRWRRDAPFLLRAEQQAQSKNGRSPFHGEAV